MTFWQHVRLWLRAEDTSHEAQAEMAKLEELDSEVARLSIELREIQQHNNFSGMVDRAIRRSAQEGS
jgi:hypothetical protein